jgi:hypothetical protein
MSVEQLAGYLKHPLPATGPVARFLKKETST